MFRIGSNVCDQGRTAIYKEMFTLLDLCVSSLRRGHANLLCIVPILTDDPRRESNNHICSAPTGVQLFLTSSVGVARAVDVAFALALGQGLGKGMGNGKHRSNRNHDKNRRSSIEASMEQLGDCKS